jgi:hypothetical protein
MSGVDWIDQRVPFQTSTKPSTKGPVLELPTAKQNVGQGHETPLKPPEPGSSGVGMTSQCVPSQRSASGPPGCE